MPGRGPHPAEELDRGVPSSEVQSEALDLTPRVALDELVFREFAHELWTEALEEPRVCEEAVHEARAEVLSPCGGTKGLIGEGLGHDLRVEVFSPCRVLEELACGGPDREIQAEAHAPCCFKRTNMVVGSAKKSPSRVR